MLDKVCWKRRLPKLKFQSIELLWLVFSCVYYLFFIRSTRHTDLQVGHLTGLASRAFLSPSNMSIKN
jgi:hypothetical protein